jgi:hypothetical protein
MNDLELMFQRTQKHEKVVCRTCGVTVSQCECDDEIPRGIRYIDTCSKDAQKGTK